METCPVCVCEQQAACAVQVAAVSTAGRAYVWSCSPAEEDGRITGSLTLRVSVEASTSETCAPLCTGQEAIRAFELFSDCSLSGQGKYIAIDGAYFSYRQVV